MRAGLRLARLIAEQGIGQAVVLKHGAVTAVRVLDAPTPSLAAAAAEGARRFRFSPALHEGEPVATEIRFTYTFLLE